MKVLSFHDCRIMEKAFKIITFKLVHRVTRIEVINFLFTGYVYVSSVQKKELIFIYILLN